MVFLVPALLIAMGLTTGMTPMQQKTITGKVILADGDNDNAIGASVVIANSTVGTVVDVDGSFALNVDGDPEIVISFVGYATLRVKASKVGKKPLELEPETYKLDLETVPIIVRKTDHGTISMSTEVDDPDKPPVFVVDGKVVKEIDNLDPETLATVQVIKNPDSPETKKYNATHVVLITTKEGKSKSKTDKKKSKSEKEDVDALENNEEVFFVVEDMPSFHGGKADLKTYIYSKLEFPAALKKKGISGEVMVQFLVATTGELRDIKAVSSTHKEFEAPAVKVFEGMPSWNPGKQRGKNVQVKVVVPVRFNADIE